MRHWIYNKYVKILVNARISLPVSGVYRVCLSISLQRNYTDTYRYTNAPNKRDRERERVRNRERVRERILDERKRIGR